MAKSSLANKTGLIGALALLTLGILLVAKVLTLDIIVGIALIVVGALGVAKSL